MCTRRPSPCDSPSASRFPTYLALVAPPVAPEVETQSHSGSSSSSSSSSSNDSSGSVQLGTKRSGISKFYVLPAGGPRVKLDLYKPKAKRRYKRWIGECQEHANCKRKRSTLHGKVHGRLEPLAYIAAWSEAGAACTAAEHQERGFVVDPDAVSRWVAKIERSASLGPVDRTLDFDALTNETV